MATTPAVPARNRPFRSTTPVGLVDFVGGLQGGIHTLPRDGQPNGTAIRVGVLTDRAATVLMVGGTYVGLTVEMIDELTADLAAARLVLTTTAAADRPAIVGR